MGTGKEHGSHFFFRISCTIIFLTRKAGHTIAEHKQGDPPQAPWPHVIDTGRDFWNLSKMIEGDKQ